MMATKRICLRELETHDARYRTKLVEELARKVNDCGLPPNQVIRFWRESSLYGVGEAIQTLVSLIPLDKLGELVTLYASIRKEYDDPQAK